MKKIGRMGFQKDQFNLFVVVLDYGCYSCKDQLYEYVFEGYQKKSVLVLKRKPDQATLLPLVG